MTELVRHEATLPEKMEWSKALASSTLLPRQYQNNPGNLLFAVEYADALGVSRINAITSIHVIEGKPSASADLIASLVRRAGHKLRVSGDDTYALAQIIRADDPDFTYEARWDLDKARAAGLLSKGVWKSYPGAMLRSRAITEVARMGASDALFGVIYTPEELGVEVGDDGEVVHTVTTVHDTGSRGADRMREVLSVQPAAPAEAEPAAAPAPAAEPTGDTEGITASQLKKMGAQMREADLTDRTAALAYVAKVIGREVSSRNDLTKDEASRIIDALDRHETPTEDVVDAELVEDGDPDAIWARIVSLGENKGMSTADVQDDFAARMGGVTADSAATAELQHYLGLLEAEAPAA